MEWIDTGVVLTSRQHGETSAVAMLLTKEHGRHAGLIRGGSGKTHRAVLQSGNRVYVRWMARLENQLGMFRCELVRADSSDLLVDKERLAALLSICATIMVALPERESCPKIYENFTGFLDTLVANPPDWREQYVRWELDLLAELGYGLDLGNCVATGSNDDLAYVSPRTGRAVSASAGEPYRDRLLILPRFLLTGGASTPEELAAGLALTGYFLERHVLTMMVSARNRLVELLTGRKLGRGHRDADR